MGIPLSKYETNYWVVRLEVWKALIPDKFLNRYVVESDDLSYVNTNSYSYTLPWWVRKVRPSNK